MAVYSIICEYNPFHNGHKYQIDSLKPDTVVCLMSGNTVQRGDFSVCDKYKRAEAAVRGGADLVLELPFPYSMLSAEYFASAGVNILNRLGFVDKLSFGCECDDKEKLLHIAEYLVGEKYNADISALIKKSPSVSYAAAREHVVCEALGENYAKILTKPNNILAVEYIKALIRTDSKITAAPLLRKFSEYHDKTANGSFASAGFIRSVIEENDISSLVPTQAYDIYMNMISTGKMPCDIKKLESGILAFLRMTDAQELKSFYDCEAVAELIKKASAKAVSLEQLYDLASSANYTRTRIRRCILSAFLGVTAEDARCEPLYTSVLALNKKGAELLSDSRKTRDITVITKPSHIKKYDGTDLYRQYMSGVVADDVFALCLPQASASGEGLRRTPFVL